MKSLISRGIAAPCAATGTATVNFPADSASNGTNSPDTGFAAGTDNNIFAIDNFQITGVP